MKRSLFLTITAILGFLFGAMLYLAPGRAAHGFGMSAAPETLLLFRPLGAAIFSAGLLSFLVRNHGASPTLKAVLLFNVFMHLLSMSSDVWGLSSGLLRFSKLVPGYAVHLFVIVGSLMYLVKMEAPAVAA